ncbi:MAG: glycosyltransferase family 2 protein [Coriobacteriia bacterium]|nr:glycosyltransferase family 2 protein [Coriobacteriia bacterium]
MKESTKAKRSYSSYIGIERRRQGVGVRGLTAPRVSVVIAALNEAENLRHVLPRIPRDVYEVILVDGHSTDGTIQTARSIRPDIRIVCQDGQGKGNALRCGFAAATGDAIVAIDADGSTDPAEIPAFVGALQAGAEYVKGSRFIPGAGTADMTRTRKLGNWGFIVLVRLLFGTRYTDFNYGYTAFWRRVLPELNLRSEGFEIECEMNLRAAITGLRVVEVASFEYRRIAGEAHLRPLPDGWRVLKQLLRERTGAVSRPGVDDGIPVLLVKSTPPETPVLDLSVSSGHEA